MADIPAQHDNQGLAQMARVPWHLHTGRHPLWQFHALTTWNPLWLHEILKHKASISFHAQHSSREHQLPSGIHRIALELFLCSRER